MQKLLVYSPKISSRLQYVLDFVLFEFSGVQYELTTNIQFFEAAQVPKINLSKEDLNQAYFLEVDEFLFEKGISNQVNFEKLTKLSQIFFAISSYSDYLPQEKDQHHRISGKNKVFKTPFVDQWILNFQTELKQQYSELEFKPRNFSLSLTCDVDQAWKYKNKGFFRTTASLLKDCLKLDWQELSKKLKVMNGKEKDPFDTFEIFQEFKNSGKIDEIIFFWLMADYGAFDKNIPVSNQQFQQKIQEVSTWADYGIHPSYASNSDKEKLKIEIDRLTKIVNHPIKKSRQHYIKLEFPKTYQNLIANGIQEDYTMAYADETGFRSGTCTAYFWYDLEKEVKTNLKIFPFCAMDVSMRNYMKLSPDEALVELNRLKSEIQAVKGQMTVLFHNSNFNDEWREWGSVLEEFLK